MAPVIPDQVFFIHHLLCSQHSVKFKFGSGSGGHPHFAISKQQVDSVDPVCAVKKRVFL